jgi:hypothetical protein
VRLQLRLELLLRRQRLLEHLLEPGLHLQAVAD